MIKKLIIGSIVLATIGYAVSFFGSEGALVERFGHLDPQKVKKAHRKMYRNALKGEYNDVDLEDDNVCDEIFLKIYYSL